MKKKSLFFVLGLFLLASCQPQAAPSPTPVLRVENTHTPVATPTETAVVTDPATATLAATVAPIQAAPVLYAVDVYDPERDAAQDLKDALVLAKNANKKVILEIGGDWCPDCINLEKFIQDNRDIEEEMARQYFIVKVNISKENLNKAFLSQYPTFEWVPHFFILDHDGTLVKSLDTRVLMKDGKFDLDNFWNFLKTPLTVWVSQS